MKRTPWPVVLSVVLCLVLPALVWAGAPGTSFHFGQKAGHLTMPESAPGRSATVGQQPQNQEAAPFCPGEPWPWQLGWVGFPGGTINQGDAVVGTMALSGFVALSCDVNPSTGGTCSVSQNGSLITFNLQHVQAASSWDIEGSLEVPSYCGTIAVVYNLTEPGKYTYTENDEYACNGQPCPIPTLGTSGLAVLALLLAAIAVVVLLRRLQA